MVGSSSLHPQRTFSVVILPVSLPPAADSRHSISSTAGCLLPEVLHFLFGQRQLPAPASQCRFSGGSFFLCPELALVLRRCPGAFLQNLLVFLRQCIPCVAGSQLHLRYAAVLIGHVVPRHLVVLHGIVGRPVVFGGIDAMVSNASTRRCKPWSPALHPAGG